MDSHTLPADEAVRDKYNVCDIIDELFSMSHFDYQHEPQINNPYHTPSYPPRLTPDLDLDLNPNEYAEDLVCDEEESCATPREWTQDFTAIVEHQCLVQQALIDKRNIIIESLGYIDALADAIPSLYEWFHSESTQEDAPANWDHVINQLVGLSNLFVRLEKSTATILRIKDELEAVMSAVKDAPEEIKAKLHIISLVMEQNDGLKNDLTKIVSNLRAICA
ncbi:hypothetical protein N7451_010249 [Penicillium sp. IBT 35674x]|nr:hypothetical protein N7451_010249 [Penicillium sp. IBT 35674x]